MIINPEIAMLVITLTVSVATLLILLFTGRSRNGMSPRDKNELTAYVDSQVDLINRENARMREELADAVNKSMDTLGSLLAQNMKMSSEQAENRFRTFAAENSGKLEAMRSSLDRNLRDIREDNSKKLDEMRNVVDEKLQQTISRRMNESFNLVNQRLEQVYKGLGEMQTLAAGVGDLKKVLSNVKTRGILGEIQLGAILSEILAPEQYDENVATRRGSRAVVEFAVKIPTENGFMYLPVDSKFPGDTYAAWQNACEEADRDAMDDALKRLLITIRNEAKDIHDKYLDPPNTTDFAVMFLPFEGLYAEVVNSGITERIQREYHVCVAGPSTMAALLNSLQMGFRSVAIQRRSGEVWAVLGSVKTEFDKFESALQQTQQRLNQANDELDKLVGVRTRQMQRRLREVTELAAEEGLEERSYES
ncbi:MAG: DNA recombination protein RmuC [Clostridia bacterium]|nr:DNA recombination protein RmuC [Clostridia bacterium]